MAIIHDCISFRGNGPIAANGELLRVVAAPDLDLIGVLVRQPRFPHRLLEVLPKVIGIVLAHQEILLSSDDHLQIGSKVRRKRASHVVGQLLENGGQVVRRNVLRCVNSNS